MIVHCASAQRGDLEATRHLLEVAKSDSRRPHLVYVSIVGVGGISYGYFRTKLAAERAIIDSGLPWTIQRATQFYDFVLKGARSTARFPIVIVPKDFLVQPINPVEVAESLADLAVGPPRGRVPDMGGPQVLTWAAMTRAYLRAIRRRRAVVELPMPGTRAIRAGGLLVREPAGRHGRQTWDEFLAEKTTSTQVSKSDC